MGYVRGCLKENSQNSKTKQNNNTPSHLFHLLPWNTMEHVKEKSSYRPFMYESSFHPSLSLPSSLRFSLCACVYVYVREIETERKKQRESVFLSKSSFYT